MRLKTRWRDGTTHLRFEPIELMERLAAQIPRPRINQVLYAGVLAPNAKLRSEIVRYERPEPMPADRDVLGCPRCGGRLRHIATILD